MAANHLKSGLDAAQAHATEEHARAITAAFRAGAELPALPEVDSAALALASARLNALHQSACELAAEANAARAEATAAAAVVNGIVDGIVRLNGSLLPHKLQTDLLEQVDRRKAAIARDPLYIETHNWHGFLDGLAADQERVWLAYGQRLANDATATFEGREESAQ